MARVPLAMPLLFFILLAGAANAATIVFDFEDQAPPGSPVPMTTLAMTKDGLTATVTRSSGSTFEITGFADLGTFLLAPTEPFTDPAPFVLDFSQVVGSVSLTFNDPAADRDTLVVEAFSGLGATGAVLDSATDTCCDGGRGPNGQFESITLAVAAPEIASIRFIGGSPALPNSGYYDDIVVETAAAVPEPAAFGMLGLGFISLTAWRAKGARRPLSASGAFSPGARH